jgi:DNA-binding transcriptional ArsR family regulator
MTTYDVAMLEYARQIRQQILSFYKDGKQVSEIALLLNLTQTSVYRHLKVMGVHLPPRKRNNKGQYTKN